ILAIKLQVDVLFVNDLGNPEGRVWRVHYGSISNIRRAQLNFLYSTKVVSWVKDLIAEKLHNQVALLLAFQTGKEQKRAHNIFKSSIKSIKDYKRKIQQVEAEYISDIAPSIRGWEGASGKKYFRSIAELMPEAYRFEGRDRLP